MGKINTINCQQCGKTESFVVVNMITRNRRFCSKCARMRKKAQIKFSNNNMSTGKPVGRPLKVKEEIVSRMLWDESAELGY